MAISTSEDLADLEERGQQHDHAGTPVPPRVSDDGCTWWCPVEIAGRNAWMEARITPAGAAEGELCPRGG